MSGEAPPARRRVIRREDLVFRPFDRYGAPRPGVEWHSISEDPESGAATYYVRYHPGARSTPHEHVVREEFLIVEGSFVDHDGRVFTAGDFVTYDPGSRHWSHSPDGCLLLVVLRGRSRGLEPGETLSHFA